MRQACPSAGWPAELCHLLLLDAFRRLRQHFLLRQFIYVFSTLKTVSSFPPGCLICERTMHPNYVEPWFHLNPEFKPNFFECRTGMRKTHKHCRLLRSNKILLKFLKAAKLGTLSECAPSIQQRALSPAPSPPPPRPSSLLPSPSVHYRGDEMSSLPAKLCTSLCNWIELGFISHGHLIINDADDCSPRGSSSVQRYRTHLVTTTTVASRSSLRGCLGLALCIS